MKHLKLISLLLTAGLFMIITSCGGDDGGDPTPPSTPVSVGTPTFSNISTTSATVTAIITGDGILKSGICYATTATPTIEAQTATLSANQTTLTGLTASTTYYVRSFATTKNGTTYSSVQSFTTEAVTPTPTPSTSKMVGGDISLLTKYETNGAVYADKDGNNLKQKYGDNYMLKFFKEQGLNSMRVRLFVDPSRASAEAKGQGVCQDLDYVKVLGKRIKDMGMTFMLDFHYSDTWADPSHQATPYLFTTVNTPVWEYIYTYTKEVLQALVAAGATPDFIQTGNEITWGMMWDGCKVNANSSWTGYQDANWDVFSTALKNASRACREVCPQAKIILHTEQVGNPTLMSDFYQRAGSNGVDYDIIGLSYYPYYHGNLTQLNTALTTLENKFANREIMIVETGCSYHYKVGDNDQGYPLTEAGQRQFTTALVAILKQHNNVKGLYWWMMEANEYGLDWNTKRVTDNWYNASLFDNETGKAQAALYELQNFK